MLVLCAVEDYTCPHCDANGICMLSNDPYDIYDECDDFAAEVGEVEEIEDFADYIV